MFVFWWSGRGYLTMIVVLGSLCAFAIIFQAAGAMFEIPSSLWGLGLIAAAALNWHVGSRANRKKLAALRPKNPRERLLYRARHRFMSMPMETFSIVIALAGVAVIARGLITAS